MKKLLSFLLTITVIVSLTACGAPKQVPDQTIAWVVEDYLEECGHGSTDEFSYETTHSYDSATKTDTVNVSLSANLPTSSLNTSYSGTYQYDKTRDLWTLIRGGNWMPISVRSYNLIASKNEILKAIREIDYSAEIDETIHIIDLLSLDPKTEVTDSWIIQGQDSLFMYCESSEHDIAFSVFMKTLYLLYQSNLTDILNDLASQKIESAVGENYYCLKLHSDAIKSDVYLICQDTAVFIIGITNNVNNEKIMNNIGFIPEMVWEPFNVESGLKAMIYKSGEAFLESGDYYSAIEVFTKLGDYEDSASKALEVRETIRANAYANAESLMNSGSYEQAKIAFEALKDYKDSAELATYCNYMYAGVLLSEASYEEAKEIFEELGDYRDSGEKLLETQNIIEEKNIEEQYHKVLQALNEHKYGGLEARVEALGDYKDSAKILKELHYYDEAMDSLEFREKEYYLCYDRFVPALQLETNCEYVCLPDDTKRIVDLFAPFLGIWEYTDGDDKLLSYIGNDPSKYNKIPQIEIKFTRYSKKPSVSVFDLNSNYSIGGIIADYDASSLTGGIYVGGDFVFSLKDDNTLIIDFFGKSGMPKHVTVCYTRG